MIIVLHGKDNFRTDRKLKKIVSGYKKKNKSGINITYLPENPSFRDLKDGSRQMGMFEEKRLLIGKNILENKKVKKEMEKRLDELIAGDNILILKEDKKVKGKLVNKIEKLDKNQGLIQEFDKLEGRKLKNWYKIEFSNYDVDLKRGAINKMVEYIGDDLWRAKNEINKLSLMNLGEEISVEEVTKNVRPDFNVDIFKTVEALSKGDKGAALEMIEEHIKNGDSVFYILSMINYQIRNLLIVKELEDKGLKGKEAKSKSRLHPYAFKKTKTQSKSFSLKKLKKIHRKLSKVDLDSKLGRINPETGLMLVISQF